MPQSYETYNNYQVTDFLLDDYFIQSIKNPDAETSLFWSRFEELYPHQKGNISNAEKLIGQLNFQRDLPDENSREKVWERIGASARHQPAKVVGFNNRRWWLVAASVLTIVCLGSIFFYNSQPSEKFLQTGNGEKKQIVLPDNSIVVLNANSSLKYAGEWQTHAAREVWIKGEAYFNVTHLNSDSNAVKNNERFIVHLDKLDIEVLGTTFTVKERRQVADVVLQTGKIKVTVSDSKEEPVIMRPDERLSYDAEKKQLSTNVVEAGKQGLWKDNQLTFSNTSLSEVIRMIEDNYGLKVIVNDPSLLEKKWTGSVSSENQEVLFKALEVIFDVNLLMNNDTLLISKK